MKRHHKAEYEKAERENQENKTKDPESQISNYIWLPNATVKKRLLENMDLSATNIENEEIFEPSTVIRKMKGSSLCWKFLFFKGSAAEGPHMSKVFCKLCTPSVCLVYNSSGSTSNLVDHMKRHHKTEYEKAEKENHENKIETPDNKIFNNMGTKTQVKIIDPLGTSAIVKTRLLGNILEIVNSNDEKFLDISIVCRDGSFLWSQFLLAAASDLFATAMQGVEVTHVIFPDLQVEDVRGSLRGLLCNTSLKTDLLSSTDYSPILNAGDIDSFVKEEIDEEIEFKSDSIMVIHPSNNGEIKMEPSIQQDPRKRTRKQEHTTLDDYEDYEGSYMLEP